MKINQNKNKNRKENKNKLSLPLSSLTLLPNVTTYQLQTQTKYPGDISSVLLRTSCI